MLSKVTLSRGLAGGEAGVPWGGKGRPLAFGGRRTGAQAHRRAGGQAADPAVKRPGLAQRWPSVPVFWIGGSRDA